MEENTKIEKIYIECDCGSHLLQISSELDTFDCSEKKGEEPKTVQHQYFYLAMFSYGEYNKKKNIWQKISVAWRYLKTGEMFSDQLVLNIDEAKKLSDFINNNLIK